MAFQSFPTQAAGIHAQEAQLERYYNNGLRNVSSIVNRYAPPNTVGGDNTPEQVHNYIGYVSKRLGVNPMDTLSTPMIPRLAQAMREFETGKRPY